MNFGYQRDDERIVDYQLWSLPQSDLPLRGPAPEIKPGQYIVVIGAAQTFGRFVPKPYAAILHERTGLPVLNLGISGAGPSFFLKRPELLKVINDSRLAVVQVMSGRSTSNSSFVTEENQGLVKPLDGNINEAVFAETAYRNLLATEDEERLVCLRAEVRARAASEMIALLGRITVPRVLLWFSKRHPDYKPSVRDIGGFWGDFPHFLDADFLDQMGAYCDATAVAVCAEGLPQPLLDRFTGEPVLMWPAEKFPSVRLRCHNHYYPSPEMHLSAADALAGPVTKLLTQGDGLPSAYPVEGARRDVLVHMHIYKNAGTSLDAVLSDSFGDAFINVDPDHEQVLWSEKQLVPFARPSRVKALACHQARQPIVGDNEVRLWPYFLIRHPIDRLESVYEFERRPDRVHDGGGVIGRWANEMEFGEFIEKCCLLPRSRRIVSNFQTGVLGRICPAADAAFQEDWDQPVRSSDLLRALRLMEEMPAVGVVERFEESVVALKEAYRLRFPELTVRSERRNSTRRSQLLSESLAAIKERLGGKLYSELLALNAMDLALWSAANKKLG